MKTESRLIVNVMRVLILAAVFGSLVSGGAIIVVGLISIFKAVWDLVEEGNVDLETVRHFSVEVIEVADAFLLGVVMFIIAVGLYQLFVDPRIEVPAWLEVTTLSDLKEDLLAVTIVLLGISFLGRVVEWEGDKAIIYYGGAIAAVLVPLVAMFGLLFYVNKEEEQKIHAAADLAKGVHESGPQDEGI